jgi:hypothetical protein
MKPVANSFGDGAAVRAARSSRSPTRTGSRLPSFLRSALIPDSMNGYRIKIKRSASENPKKDSTVSAGQITLYMRPPGSTGPRVTAYIRCITEK